MVKLLPILMMAALWLGSCSSSANVLLETQPGIVHGFVRDANTLKPLPGINVLLGQIKGGEFRDSRLGTITGRDGGYQLDEVPIEDGAIEVSFVGYYAAVAMIPPENDTTRIDILLVPRPEPPAIIVCGKDCE